MSVHVNIDDKHLVTVGGLNDAYQTLRDVDEAINNKLNEQIDTENQHYNEINGIISSNYEHLHTEIENIASAYDFKGGKTWNELMGLSSATNGDAYSVSGYPTDDGDDLSDNSQDKIFICKKAFSSAIDRNEWKEYWYPLGFDINQATPNVFGLIKNDESYKATSNDYGFVKIGYSSTDNNYALSLNNDGQAYVNIPTANGEDGIKKGVIALGYNETDIDRALKADPNGVGHVDINTASTGKFGLVKISGSTEFSDNQNKFGIVDNSGLYTVIPTATTDKLGLVKIKDLGDGDNNYGVGFNSNETALSVNIPTANIDNTTNTRGLVKLGTQTVSQTDNKFHVGEYGGTSADKDTLAVSIPTASTGIPGLVQLGTDDEIEQNYDCVVRDVGFKSDETLAVSIPISHEDELGLVQLGTETVSGNIFSVGYETTEDGATNEVLKVGIPTASDDTLGLVQIGDELNYNYDDGTISGKKYEAGADDGISITPNDDNYTIHNTGIRSLSYSYEDSGATETIKIDNTEVEISSNISGAIKFDGGNGTDVFDVPIYGWDADTWNDCVKRGGEHRIGSASKPIYVENDTAREISSIVLANTNGNNTVASFTVTNNKAVSITGGSVSGADDDGNKAALYVNGGIYATSGIVANKVYHAVWNDITDAIEVDDECVVEPGRCYVFDGEKYTMSSRYCQDGIIGIHSDTSGALLGRKGRHKELDIAIGGFVLAYVDKEYKVGTPLTCGADGTLTKIGLVERLVHPERIVATYWKSEEDEEWGDMMVKVKVNGRKWVKIK